MFRTSFKEVFKGGLKHINSLSKKVCFVVVVCQSSQLPEQKEGLFSQCQGSGLGSFTMLVFYNVRFERFLKCLGCKIFTASG